MSRHDLRPIPVVTSVEPGDAERIWRTNPSSRRQNLWPSTLAGPQGGAEELHDVIEPEALDTAQRMLGFHLE